MIMSRDAHLEHLVLAPFRETVEKATTALENAAAAKDDTAHAMQRAAKSLLSKGERALKKIEPLCERSLDEYGVNFVNVVKDNEEIATYREQLNDLLWDLDDHIDADSFEEEAYDKLAAALRTAALRIADVLATMKVEKQVAAAPEATRRRDSFTASERGDGRSVIQTGPGVAEEPEDADVEATTRENVARGDAGCGVIAVPEREQPIETICPQDIPPEPDTNPWENTAPAPYIEAGEQLERRPPVEEGESRDLISPLTPDNRPGSPVFYHPGRLNEEAAANPRASIASRSSLHSTAERAVARNSVGSSGSLTASRLSLTPASAVPLSQGPHGSPAGSRLSLTPVTSHSSGRLSGSLSIQQPGLEVVKIPNDDYDGPIPLSPQTTDVGLASGITSALDCKIDKNSSFFHFRGYCEGAKEALRQGDFGVKKNRKGATVAKCKYCHYELDWRLIDADANGFADANYTSSSVSFRLRFLAKSHLPARQPSDRLYACHFCIYAGQTPRPSDATVFFSQKDLCAHIARHPRPLPHIPALTVLDADASPEVPEHLANNYDVRFTRPSIPSAVPDGPEMANLPCAVATESFRMTIYGLRMPPDRAETLQFVVGQKIVGIEFPARYEGEWAVGWADDEKGVFPVEYVRLVPPPRRDWRATSWGSGGSGGGGGGGRGEMSAVARWKMSPPSSSMQGKGNTEEDARERWLKFGKGEVITGISFPYEEHWCWSGRNAKGKWGIFPRAFMQPKSLRGPSEEGSVDESSIGKNSIWTWRSKKGRGELGYAVEEVILGLGRRSLRVSDY
ncbi:SH3 domain-containing protein [Madurella fahalii]|uniref:SH3 domain-containing protein n=1 Tax=Madurella fahalii TaxID=1157608 RepID=A0ABQ0GM77_9PEZI